MTDKDFISAVHAANDAGFIITTDLRHSSPEAKRAELRGDIFEIVIRRGMSVFWIGNSFDRHEVQALATQQIHLYVREEAVGG